MLVLDRKRSQGVVIGNSIHVTVLEIRGNRVKLGFAGPPDVPIHRDEIANKRGDGPSSAPVPKGK